MNCLKNSCLFLIALWISFPLYAQVGINTTATTADPSAMLDVSSTDRGVLVPRMTSTERMAIPSPATGLLVYDTDATNFWFYDGGWNSISGGYWQQTGTGEVYNTGLGEVFIGTTTSLGLPAQLSILAPPTSTKSGIYVRSDNARALYARSEFHEAVQGYSIAGLGVAGYSSSGRAVHGGTAGGHGVSGYTSTGNGLDGTSYSGMGVYAISSLNYAGFFDGDVYAVGNYLPSARMLKRNEAKLGNALSIIQQLQPKTYTYKTKEFQSMNLPEGKRYGFIAEEIEEVLPQFVREAATEIINTEKYYTQPEPGELPTREVLKEVEFKAVNYTELIPILVGAIQEQQAEIENLKAQVQALGNNK